MRITRSIPFSCLLAFVASVESLCAADSSSVDFNRDIRPILSDKCFHCHGPDATNQDSDFRIDTREHATEGEYAIVPGSLEDSEVHRRIRLPNDDYDVMPPLDSNRILSNREKDLLDAWIEEGAEYDLHWSFKKPQRPEVPSLTNPDLAKRVVNPIDAFVFARLESEGLTPQPPAELETRIRRASLTLTGLPPETDDWKDYDAFVQHALASIHYAERQALRWLSAARFADTDGYQNDAQRHNWPWRDWVIQAFHQNKPFDEFTIEQLAGDLLPDASDDQILATAFNRNHRQNAEGGALAPEFLVENVIDRVETTSTVWLGLTMGCARCHDHKYDPLSQKEFFQMFAYFNNIGEQGIGPGVRANPIMETSSPLVEPPPELVDARSEAKIQLGKASNGINKRRDAWIAKVEKLVGGVSTKTENHWVAQTDFVSATVSDGTGELIGEDDGAWLFEGQNVTGAEYELIFVPQNNQAISEIRLDAIPHPTFGNPRRLARSSNGNFVLTDFKIEIVNQASGESRSVKIERASASFEQHKYGVGGAIDDDPHTGWAVFGPEARAETVSATFQLKDPVSLAENEQLRIRMSHGSRYTDHNIGRFKLWINEARHSDKFDLTALSPQVLSALKSPAALRSKVERQRLASYYRTVDPITQKAMAKVNAAEKALRKAGAPIVPVMVMNEREGDRVPAYLLQRGQYDAPDLSEKLDRGLPAAFFGGPQEDQPQDRLELARWIVSNENPLTARVVVNRIWQDHFGTGLVTTTEDFGAQGSIPSHPKLLDWLAVELMESGWDLKALHQLILTSATYQQDSSVGDELLEKDPKNSLLARGPRYRLDGFTIRDVALQASGLLSTRVGGPPVKPYQPVGLWSSVSGNANGGYKPSAGQDLYRKSLYTYWKRAVNPPRQLIFDAGGREACDVGLRRTNTPLQALVLMNDPTFLEAARHLAQRVMQEEKNQNDRLTAIYRDVTALTPSAEQLEVLRSNYDYFLNHFEGHLDQAAEFLKAGDSPRDESLPIPEHAAWTAVAHLVLNLDTTISLQ